jgi:hypothetical protein
VLEFILIRDTNGLNLCSKLNRKIKTWKEYLLSLDDN